MIWKQLELTGWGRSSRAACRVARPERQRDAAAAVVQADERSVLAFGAGRSYADTGLNTGGAAVLTERLNRILAFDQTTGEIVVEPGVTFRDLLEVFLPRGFLVPVSPGTAYATIGGAVANDVHGKNHEAVGSFGHHVRWVELLLPSGDIVRASPEERPDLFAATIGGIGLTGILLAISFSMTRVPSNAVALREQRVRNLDAFLDALKNEGEKAHFSVGWIDALAGGRSLGRGILETAEPSNEEIAERRRKTHAVPMDCPGFLLNRWSVKAFNALYYRRFARRERRRRLAYGRFLYPLDALLDWNRLYGARGFHQFQCVVPFEAGALALRQLLDAVRAGRNASPLAVLKTLGAAGLGHLSFPMPGYTLAVDLPRKRGVEDLLAKLEAITLDHGGRIYLAKDSSLSAEGFARMYPKLEPFRAVLADIDPDGRMASDMARRLQIRDGS
ncbi:MAG: FAD-binding oxidoreductase [Rhodospirillales bacterium]|nr:FAD-binding oxidoreductase [Paracoccaceae bacterium]MDH3910553.1 FAD-binding oxidoreductase [Rhodospirillales bacterium]MDH3918331.1 FAD-binding oxidoreductase [Rhodospirillales bacterium]MDH3968567.1 FAD-binding oxidoreductase [Rhodospirillales bacterium]